MLKKLISVLLSILLLAGVNVCAFADDPTQERSAYAFYRTDNAACIFFNRTVSEITPVVVKTTRFGHDGVYPSLVSEGKTPVTYVVVMDATWYMRDRRSMMKALVEALFQNSFAKTRVILAPYDVENGLLAEQIVDSDIYANVDEGLEAIQRQIDSINYYFQGETVPATRGILDTLNWISDSYPSETGGIVNVIVTSYMLKSMTSRPEQVEDIRQRLASMPQITFHTVQLGERDGEIPVFKRGLHLVIKDDYPASAVANAIHEYVGNLERVLVPWLSQESALEDVLLFFKPIIKAPDGTEYMPSGVTIQAIPYVVTSNTSSTVGYDATESDY